MNKIICIFHIINYSTDSKGKPSSSPVFASFLDKWMKGLFSSDSTTKSVDQKPSLRDSDSPLRKSFRFVQEKFRFHKI